MEILIIRDMPKNTYTKTHKKELKKKKGVHNIKY